MPNAASHEQKRVLITVRTYPAPAKKGVEVSCSAGVTADRQWIRLFPIPYRFLSFDKRFRKYQWIEVAAKRSSDPRPESYEVDIDSIHVLGEPLPTHRKWEQRKELVFPLASPSLCQLQEQQRLHGAPTLGFFKPREIRKLILERDSSEWGAAEKQRLGQYSLFEKHPHEMLEKIPYKFIYEFVCADSSCNGHRLSCVDWEMGQSYRKWRDHYGPDKWPAAFRNKYESEMMIRFDTHFFVGTVRIHPNSWIIVGLFYPPK